MSEKNGEQFPMEIGCSRIVVGCEFGASNRSVPASLTDRYLSSGDMNNLFHDGNETRAREGVARLCNEQDSAARYSHTLWPVKSNAGPEQ